MSEIASLQPPRNYQELRAENARVVQEPTPQTEKPQATNPTSEAAHEQQPKRPEQVRASAGRVTDSGGMEAQQALANDLMKQNRANEAIRQGDRIAAGKGFLATDLAEAKQGKASGDHERDTGQAASANGQQQNQPAASPSRDGAGKETLAADLKEAKEHTHGQEQTRDPSRSR